MIETNDKCRSVLNQMKRGARLAMGRDKQNNLNEVRLLPCPAHEAIRLLVSQGITWQSHNGQTIDYKQLLAEFDALPTQPDAERWREAMVILPDDAEPDVGDIVWSEYWIASSYINSGRELASIKYDIENHTQDWKIIQRNGKPVVYQSALAATTKSEG